MSRRILLLAAATVTAAGLLVLGEPVHTQGRPAWPPALSGPTAGEVEVLPVAGNVHVITNAGANITLLSTDAGQLLVDTGTAPMSEKVWAAVQSISRRPLRYIVNTSEHADHTGGNAAIAPKGKIIPLRERNYTAGPMGTLEYDRASVIAYLTVLHRMSGIGGRKPVAQASWPDNTFSTPLKRFNLGGEPVVIMHQPSNTDGNSIVLFRKSDVISAGDLLDLAGYPLIDVSAGGSIQLVVEGLNRLIDTTVPGANAEGGTLVVPGHGRVADHAEVATYRDMITVVRDRIADMIRRKMTLDQVKAARPTRDYDPRYGRTAGAWTTDMFIEAAYRSLATAQGPRTN
jgi:glyoxylase-like metal-dependent hydrolase (beta-lactamase superfamily II)